LGAKIILLLQLSKNNYQKTTKTAIIKRGRAEALPVKKNLICGADAPVDAMRNSC
jgi:hypothetical protein